MVESMSATAERIKHYETVHGSKEVEAFLDAVLAIEEHIDPSLVRPKLSWSVDDEEEEETGAPATPYDDLWELDHKGSKEKKKRTKKVSAETGKRHSAVHRRAFAGAGALAARYFNDDERGNAVFLAAA